MARDAVSNPLQESDDTAEFYTRMFGWAVVFLQIIRWAVDRSELASDRGNPRSDLARSAGSC